MNRHQRRSQQKQPSVAVDRGLNPLGQREFQGAIQLMKEGRWQASEAAHKRVLLQNPRHSPTLHHLGLIAFKMGQTCDAIESLRLALEVEPKYAEARLNLAIILRMHGELPEALAECRMVTNADPRHATAHVELGHILRDMGDNADAVRAYRRALELRKDVSGIGVSLAQCLIDSGDFEAGLDTCRRFVERNPAHAVARRILIRTLAHLGRVDEAQREIERFAHGNDHLRNEFAGDLATGLHKSGQSLKAIAVLRTALTRDPDAVNIYLHLGSVLKDIGRLDEAFDALKSGLDRDPSRADGYVALGFVLYEQGAVDGSIAALRQAVSLNPALTAGHIALGSVLQTSGRFEEAQQAFEAATSSDQRAIEARIALSNVRRQMCDWDGLDQYEIECLGALRRSRAVVTPFQLLGMPVTNDDMRVCGGLHARKIAQKVSRISVAEVRARHVSRGDKIRIGYLSSDFAHHATSMLLAEVLELHDRDKFEVVGYCHSAEDGSALRRRVIDAFDRFVSVTHMSHHDAADRIRSDGVEILVDLKGYTRGARQEILAQRPAPVQVSYLGYPATTGAEYLDYMIADAVVAPMAHQSQYSEKLVHLTSCYQPNDRKRRIDPWPVTRADCGLPEDGFVFCSFNNAFKINRTYFSIWMRLLEQVPGSVLWLLPKEEVVRRNLRREAALHGVDPDRLVFADYLPIDQHLARHAVADLFLDSHPCNAHTTASDALWAGLPLLTCLGEAFAGRVAASILTGCGMQELITSSLEDYAATALHLARAPNQLADLRAKLRESLATAPLYDTPTYVRGLESAFLRMSQLYRSGQSAQSFCVTDEV